MQNKTTLVKIFNVLIAVISAVLTSVFAVLFVTQYGGEFLNTYGTAINIAIICLSVALLAVTIIFIFLNKEIVYKIGLMCLVILALCAVLLYILFKTGFLDKVDSVEDLRAYIASYGSLSVVIFLAVQILQVTIVPIPGVITVGAGVLLFGPFWGAVFSYIGIMIGSFIAFFIGRKLGYKVACWLVGKENLDKGIALIKGKDKIILTFMFLFPFFPDDVLCFVTGLSSMSVKYFSIMITITRLISTFSTAYSVNGSFIPYDTWWGILIWAVLILGCLWLVKIVYKNSDKIENFFKSKKNK